MERVVRIGPDLDLGKMFENLGMPSENSSRDCSLFRISEILFHSPLEAAWNSNRKFWLLCRLNGKRGFFNLKLNESFLRKLFYAIHCFRSDACSQKQKKNNQKTFEHSMFCFYIAVKTSEKRENTALGLFNTYNGGYSI